jgi:hypothetical protein
VVLAGTIYRSHTRKDNRPGLESGICWFESSVSDHTHPGLNVPGRPSRRLCPCRGVTKSRSRFWRIAQSVEQHAVNVPVGGSIPPLPANSSPWSSSEAAGCNPAHRGATPFGLSTHDAGSTHELITCYIHLTRGWPIGWVPVFQTGQDGFDSLIPLHGPVVQRQDYGLQNRLSRFKSLQARQFPLHVAGVVYTFRGFVR